MSATRLGSTTVWLTTSSHGSSASTSPAAQRSRWRAMPSAVPKPAAALAMPASPKARSPRRAAWTASTLRPGRQVSRASSRSGEGAPSDDLVGHDGEVAAGHHRPARGDGPIAHPDAGDPVAVGDVAGDGGRADHPAAVRRDDAHQRVGQRLAAADRGRPAVVEATDGQRGGQEAGAGAARVLDRRHRQPQHEGADHRVLEGLVDDVPGAPRPQGQVGVRWWRPRAAGVRSSTGRGRRRGHRARRAPSPRRPARRGRTTGRARRWWRPGRDA